MVVSLAATLTATALEAGLRAALLSDPPTREELTALAPARLDLAFRGNPMRLSLVMTEDGVRIEANASGPADASVELSPAGLIDLLAGDQMRAVMSRNVRIEGDAGLVTAVFSVLARFRPDIEGPLSKLFGEMPVAAAGAAANRGRKLAGGVANSGADIARGALTSTDGPLPSRPEIARFLDEVDDVRLATDRLEARLARLSQAQAAEKPANET